MSRSIIVVVSALAVFAVRPAAQQLKPTGGRGLTEVHGIKVGHHTLSERPTGCTVILVEGDGAVGGVSQRGGAPGTRETDLLDPLNMVDKVNAVVLAGGSAYGLDAARGVVRYLEEHKIGWKVAAAATDGPVVEGNVGAGAGATVGKMGGARRAMKGGLGSAAIALPNGL